MCNVYIIQKGKLLHNIKRNFYGKYKNNFTQLSRPLIKNNKLFCTMFLNT